jgi:hypothetical protein
VPTNVALGVVYARSTGRNAREKRAMTTCVPSNSRCRHSWQTLWQLEGWEASKLRFWQNVGAPTALGSCHPPAGLRITASLSATSQRWRRWSDSATARRAQDHRRSHVDGMCQRAAFLQVGSLVALASRAQWKSEPRNGSIAVAVAHRCRPRVRPVEAEQSVRRPEATAGGAAVDAKSKQR